MKRRGVCIGSEPKARKWRAEAEEDDRSVGSNESIGEQLPSEDEESQDRNKDQLGRADASQQSFPQHVKNDPNPVVWMRLKLGEKFLAPLRIELFMDLYPRLIEGITALCSGDLSVSGRLLCYAGSSFHRIVRGCLAMGGDLESNRPCPDDELFAGATLSCAKAGLLCLARRGPDADGIQCCLTLGPAASRILADRYIVVGQVLGSGESESGEEKALSALRYLDSCGSSSGIPSERVVIDACGKCDDHESAALQHLLARSLDGGNETEYARYARAKFAYPPLLDVVSENNADEVMALVSTELEQFEHHAQAVDSEAQTSIEAGTATQVFQRCEKLEVGLTRLLRILDEVDFRTLGDARASGKRLQMRVRALGSRLAQAKVWSEEGETEAYEQRAGR